MITIIKSTYFSIYNYVTNPANRLVTIGIIVFMVANIVQAVIRSAIYHHADLNAFLNPTIDTRFFNGDPFINYPNNSYSSFFYSVMTLLTPFDRWFAALLWAVMNTAF